MGSGKRVAVGGEMAAETWMGQGGVVSQVKGEGRRRVCGVVVLVSVEILPSRAMSLNGSGWMYDVSLLVCRFLDVRDSRRFLP